MNLILLDNISSWIYNISRNFLHLTFNSSLFLKVFSNYKKNIHCKKLSRCGIYFLFFILFELNIVNCNSHFFQIMFNNLHILLSLGNLQYLGCPRNLLTGCPKFGKLLKLLAYHQNCWTDCHQWLNIGQLKTYLLSNWKGLNCCKAKLES